MAEFTASIASGYMTDVQFVNWGNKVVFMAHYSAPDATSSFINLGMQVVDMAAIDEADPDAMYFTSTANVCGIQLCFSGHAAADTGYIYVVGA